MAHVAICPMCSSFLFSFCAFLDDSSFENFILSFSCIILYSSFNVLLKWQCNSLDFYYFLILFMVEDSYIAPCTPAILAKRREGVILILTFLFLWELY